MSDDSANSAQAPHQDSAAGKLSPNPLAPQNLDRDLKEKTIDYWKMSEKEYNEHLASERENKIRSDAVKRSDEIRAMGFANREEIERFITNRLASISLKEEKIDRALVEIEEIRQRFRTPKNSGIMDDQVKKKEEPNPFLKWK